MTARDYLLKHQDRLTNHVLNSSYPILENILTEYAEICHESKMPKSEQPLAPKSCDNCKNLQTCRYWADAPNNGAICNFYIRYIKFE
jgi:hypothetical protein